MSELAAPRLSCRDVVDLLTDYLDGALPPLTHERVEAHLATCPDCTAYLEQIRATIDVVGRLREEDLPEPMRDDLMRAFRDWSAR